MNFDLPDFTKLHWQLNVALIGGIFSVFCLIFNDYYIYYGLLTVAYGVVSTSILPALEQLFPKNKFRNYLIVQSVLTLIWLVGCYLVYS